MLYIKLELSYDNFHDKGEKIYRISVKHFKEGKLEYDSPVFTPPMGPSISESFPEVVDYTRLSTNNTFYLNVNENPVKVDQIKYAGGGLFRMFNFKLMKGNPETALIDPYSIILSQLRQACTFGETQ